MNFPENYNKEIKSANIEIWKIFLIKAFLPWHLRKCIWKRKAHKIWCRKIWSKIFLYLIFRINVWNVYPHKYLNMYIYWILWVAAKNSLRRLRTFATNLNEEFLYSKKESFQNFFLLYLTRIKMSISTIILQNKFKEVKAFSVSI